jgi:hypothetical protein
MMPSSRGWKTIALAALTCAATAASACGDDGGEQPQDARTPDAGLAPDGAAEDAPPADAALADAATDPDAATDAAADAAVDPDPDAGPDGGSLGACHELAAPLATFDSYPAELDGNLIGAGADITLQIEDCGGDYIYAPSAGEDAIIHLTNLTPGVDYHVQLFSSDWMNLGILTGCTDSAGGPVGDECLLLMDNSDGWGLPVVGPRSGELFVLIDTPLDASELESGDYTVKVFADECAVDADCPDAEPYCRDYQCSSCNNDFQCTDPSEPICYFVGCGAGPDTCAGDDAGEPDDGPAAAYVFPDSATTTVERSLCVQPERDWFRFTILPGESRTMRVEFDAEVPGTQLLFWLHDAAGEDAGGWGLVSSGHAWANLPTHELDAGTYFLEVILLLPSNAPLTSYSLTWQPATSSLMDDWEAPVVRKPARR